MASFEELRRSALEVNASMERHAKSRTKMIQQMALSYIDPRSQQPFVFPSFAPTRTGAATFPLVFGLEAGVDVPAEGALIVSPTRSPALVSTPAPEPYSDTNIFTSWSYSPWFNIGGTYNWNDVTWARDGGCTQVLHNVGGYPAFELYPDATDPGNITFRMYRTTSDPTTTVELMFYLPGTGWVASGSFVASQAGINTDRQIDWRNSGYTAFRLRATTNGDFTSYDDIDVYCNIVNITTGVTCTPPVTNSFVMNARAPDWSSLFADSEWVNIVAVSALLTYEGPLLTNGGSMAVCNTDEDLVPGDSWYNTVTSQPFDVYKGRLAPMGSSPGGAHWHYLPSTVNEFTLASPDYEGSKGVFAWSGFTEGILRVQIDIVVNFHSKKPQYSMIIPPPFDGVSSALYLLRKEIPVVSSNDTHGEKISKHLKRLLANLEKVDPYAAARVMSEMARISSVVATMAGQPQYAAPLGVISTSLRNASARPQQAKVKAKPQQKPKRKR